MIVVAIVGILSAATFIFLNPGEYMRRGRDSTRIAQLNSINALLAKKEYSGSRAPFIRASVHTIYISLPDASSTCGTYGLVAPAGWRYQCASPETYLKTDGTGWIPVDISDSREITALPIDPRSDDPSHFYAFIVGPQNTFSLSALFESERMIKDTAIKDAGNDDARYEIGTEPSLWSEASGLRAYWKLDENTGTLTADTSGNHATGTLENGATWGQNCRKNGCLDLSGSGSRNVSVASQDSLNFGTGDFNISGWFYLSALPNAWTGIVNKAGSGIVGYGMTIDSSNRFTADIQGVSGSNQHISASSALSAGRWYFGSINFKRSDKAYLYLDGALIKSGAYASGNDSSVSNSSTFRLGAFTSGSWLLKGYIDEVRLYSRTLSDAEIRALYLAGK